MGLRRSYLVVCEVRFTIQASRILRTPLADFFSILLGSDCRRDGSEITEVALVAGAERMDLLYSEGGGEFH